MFLEFGEWGSDDSKIEAAKVLAVARGAAPHADCLIASSFLISGVVTEIEPNPKATRCNAMMPSPIHAI